MRNRVTLRRIATLLLAAALLTIAWPVSVSAEEPAPEEAPPEPERNRNRDRNADRISILEEEIEQMKRVLVEFWTQLDL